MKAKIAKITLGAAFVFSLSLAAQAAALPSYNASGAYTVNFNYLGSDYGHDVNLTQDNAGNLTGNGGSPVGANVYTWVITSGSVSGSNISFQANYTATADAVTPQTTMLVTGTIAPNGSMSGTWSDNYQGGFRTGTWTSASGAAALLVPTKDTCKNNGWKAFINPSFKNQGDCVSSVVSKK